jgi:GNAT superfamily N-acetyltransferase
MRAHEFTPNNLVDKFLQTLSPNDVKYFSVRDNCGFAALEMKSWAQNYGIALTRVQGYFLADRPVYDRADFTKDMRRGLAQQGLNFNSAKDRQSFIEHSPKYAEEWKKIPHYWLEDAAGNIYDPSGKLQFIRTKLAKDLNSARYLKTQWTHETLDEASTNIAIKIATPQELDVNLKQQVIDLVAQGGEVANNFISTGINRAKLLGIAVDQDRVVAVTAVKQPLTEYRNKVFAAAGVADLADQYPYESGYSYTDPEYRPSGVSARLHREVFRRVNQPMFATVRSDNRVALLGLQRLGFAAIGQPYASSRGDYTLTLLVKS